MNNGIFNVRFFRKSNYRRGWAQFGHITTDAPKSKAIQLSVETAKDAARDYGRVLVIIKKDDRRYKEGERLIYKKSIAA